jgi:HEAT repeat protein
MLIAAGVSSAVVASAIIVAIVLYVRFTGVGPMLNDLAGDDANARNQALIWLAEAPPQDDSRGQVTAALEPLIFEGDVRGQVPPDLVLRVYLHWANQDNVPALMRMADGASLPSWSPEKTGLVMETLGKLGDKRAADVLARKLPDPELHNQAVDALKLLGPSAENAVLEYLFDSDHATQQRAGDLLALYGTRQSVILAEARRRLLSNDPADRCAAAEWFAVNPPNDDLEKSEVAPALAGLLSELSPQVNGEALRALKLWGTKESLPQLVDFARRQEKAAPSKETAANNSLLIDLLAQFPDATSADAIALQLRNPELRDKAAQALVKLGPISTTAILADLDDPDAGVRTEAQDLCRILKIPTDRQLEQTLADIADARTDRSCVALQSLAKLRPDDASRTKVSRALNAALLDPNSGIQGDALNAARTWATPENTATLLRLLDNLHWEGNDANLQTVMRIGDALIAIGPSVEDAVIPMLKSPEAIVRREACRILGEVGTEKSQNPLLDAAQAYVSLDPNFYNFTHLSVAKIQARK